MNRQMARVQLVKQPWARPSMPRHCRLGLEGDAHRAYRCFQKGRKVCEALSLAIVSALARSG